MYSRRWTSIEALAFVAGRARRLECKRILKITPNLSLCLVRQRKEKP